MGNLIRIAEIYKEMEKLEKMKTYFGRSGEDKKKKEDNLTEDYPLIIILIQNPRLNGMLDFLDFFQRFVRSGFGNINHHISNLIIGG